MDFLHISMNPAVTPRASSQPVSTVARRHLRGSAGTHERFITSRLPGSLPSEVFCLVTPAAEVPSGAPCTAGACRVTSAVYSSGTIPLTRVVAVEPSREPRDARAGCCAAGVPASIPGAKNGRHRMKRLAIGCACMPPHRFIDAGASVTGTKA